MAMSGGIDSSVAAMLLLEQGYELIGVTFRTYDSQLTDAHPIPAFYAIRPSNGDFYGNRRKSLDVNTLPRDTMPVSRN